MNIPALVDKSGEVLVTGVHTNKQLVEESNDSEAVPRGSVRGQFIECRGRREGRV